MDEGCEVGLVEPVVGLVNGGVADSDQKMGSFLLHLQFALTFVALVNVFIVLSPELLPVTDVRKEGTL